MKRRRRWKKNKSHSRLPSWSKWHYVCRILHLSFPFDWIRERLREGFTAIIQLWAAFMGKKKVSVSVDSRTGQFTSSLLSTVAELNCLPTQKPKTRFLNLFFAGLSHKNAQFIGWAGAWFISRLRASLKQRECDAHNLEVSPEAQHLRREVRRSYHGKTSHNLKFKFLFLRKFINDGRRLNKRKTKYHFESW